MKKLLLLFLFIICFASLCYSQSAILYDNLDIHLPQIMFHGEETNLEADFSYDQKKDAWVLTKVTENTNDFIKEINKYRSEGAPCSSGGLSPLKWNNELAKAAELHSEDMYQNDYFSHTGLNGSTFWQRVGKTDYQGQPMGENISMGQRSVEEAVRAWINSPGHCRNIMNDSANDVGYGSCNNYHTMITGRSY